MKLMKVAILFLCSLVELINGQSSDGSRCQGTSCSPPLPGAQCEAKYERDDGCCPVWYCFQNGYTSTIYGKMSSGTRSSSSWSSSSSTGGGGGGSSSFYQSSNTGNGGGGSSSFYQSSNTGNGGGGFGGGGGGYGGGGFSGALPQIGGGAQFQLPFGNIFG